MQCLISNRERKTCSAADAAPNLNCANCAWWGRLAQMFAIGALVLITQLTVQAQGGFFVLPPGLGNQPGRRGSIYPFMSGENEMRMQQLSDRSLFSGLPSAFFITGVAFRRDEQPRVDFDVTIPSIEVRLSTSAEAPGTISIDMAQNIGPDETVVFRASPVPWEARPSLDPIYPFDLKIEFTTPFLYTPARGNLLVDIIIRGFMPQTTGVDADSISGMSHIIGPANGGIGQPINVDLVTQFQWQTIPEPGSLALFAIGGGLLVLMMRSKS